MDAFSWDAIPMHLITLEEMQLNLRQLKTDGVLIYHISSRFFSLGKILAAESGKLGLESMEIDSKVSVENRLILPNQYYIIGFGEIFERIKIDAKLEPSFKVTEANRFPVACLWSDSCSNILASIQ